MAFDPEKYSRTTMPQSRGKRIMMASEAVNMLATTTVSVEGCGGWCQSACILKQASK